MKYLGILVIALSFALVCSLSVASQPYDSTGASTESVLYTFTGGTDGGYPYSALVFDQAGNLYGTTQAGGTYSSGTVFELSPGTGGWTETVLYNFGGGSQDGAYPQGSLIMDASGNLYGTTFYGVVFDAAGNLYGTTTQQGVSNAAGGVFQLKHSGTQ